MRCPLFWIPIIGLLLAAPLVAAQGLTGTYVATADPTVRLTLTESQDGAVEGALSGNGLTMTLRARRAAEGFAGTLDAAGDELPIAGSLQGTELVFEIDGVDETERVVFRRIDGAAQTQQSATPTTRPSAGGRAVAINGQALSDADLARAERSYGIRIPAGDFWYDSVLGAWGPRGGPAMGLIAPGLELGGPLPADASGRGTGIFVNGRELHLYDVVALQQITGPILPGRYFITAQGLAGLEGGPPLWNLAALAAQSQGGAGGSNTWQGRVTGASGFSDGTTGAVFLPNGGIVSTGE